MTIKIKFSTIDGCRKTATYKTVAGARKAAHARVGAHPEIGSTYAVSSDGVVTVTVSGCTLAELFPVPAPVTVIQADDYDCDTIDDPACYTPVVFRYGPFPIDDEIPF